MKRRMRVAERSRLIPELTGARSGSYDAMIMSHTAPLSNHVQRHRTVRGWSQDELARRAGVSRTEVSAIETQRVVPSVAAALALAAAFGLRVEDLFGDSPSERSQPVWAWRGPSKGSRKNDNAAAVREKLGTGYRRLHVARWTEGVAVSPSRKARSLSGLVRSNVRWVGREQGSGARQCLDELLEGRAPPKRVARDHRGVAEAIRAGWADAGVCVQLASEESGLDFLSVREETYELCYREDFSSDPRCRALIHVLASPAFRQALGELPGYDVTKTGEVRTVE